MNPRFFSGMKIKRILKKMGTLSRGRSKLAIHLRGGHLDVLLFNGQQTKHASVRIGETISDFLQDIQPQSTLLILPRAEVLQKEVSLAHADESDVLAHALNRELANSFPYAIKDMAYGLVLYPEGSQQKGWLYAIPASKLNGILNRLKEMKITITEIVTEDQTLSWLSHSTAIKGDILLLDRSEDRVLSLLSKEGKISFSQTFPTASVEWLVELAAVIGEKKQNFEKIGCTGMWKPETLQEIEDEFKIPVKQLRLCEASMSAVMSGARFWGDYPLASLLPSEQKIKNQDLSSKNDIKDCVTRMLLVMACLILAANAHLFLLKRKSATLEEAMGRRASEVRGVKTIASSLQRIDEAKTSKLRLLGLLKELSLTLPGTIRFKELHADTTGMMFSGECPSHTALTETVQNFERIKALQEVKLEHTRLRKRLNQDYLEFEVSSKWRL